MLVYVQHKRFGLSPVESHAKKCNGQMRQLFLVYFVHVLNGAVFTKECNIVVGVLGIPLRILFNLVMICYRHDLFRLRRIQFAISF